VLRLVSAAIEARNAVSRRHDGEHRGQHSGKDKTHGLSISAVAGGHAADSPSSDSQTGPDLGPSGAAQRRASTGRRLAL
jgi:hypothetical protein